MLRLVGLDHEDLVFLDDPDGRARVDEGRGLVERGKRHAQVLARRRQVRCYCIDSYQCSTFSIINNINSLLFILSHTKSKYIGPKLVDTALKGLLLSKTHRSPIPHMASTLLGRERRECATFQGLPGTWYDMLFFLGPIAVWSRLLSGNVFCFVMVAVRCCLSVAMVSV